MKNGLHIEYRADNLPLTWNFLTDHYFQQSEFLAHAEKYNPCLQRYYLWYEQGQLQAGAIAYTLQLDLLTFLRLPSPFRMHIIGVPCSVSCPGIFGMERAVDQLKAEIYRREGGFCLFLNLPEEPHDASRVSGPTLPTVILENEFPSWQDYLGTLRAHYRRRLKRILQKGQEVWIEKLPCRHFDKQMYDQYLQVYRRSKDKLEKLKAAFFQNLPQPFQLLVSRRDRDTLGWAITLSAGDQYYFFLGGVDYERKAAHETYFRLLIAIVKNGIESGAKYIDLGQTAEIPKTRMGGSCHARFLEGRHRNPLAQRLLKAGERWLVYQREVPPTHVFKREEVEALD